MTHGTSPLDAYTVPANAVIELQRACLTPYSSGDSDVELSYGTTIFGAIIYFKTEVTAPHDTIVVDLSGLYIPPGLQLFANVQTGVWDITVSGRIIGQA